MEGEGGVVRIGRSAVAIPGVGEVPVPAVVAASGPRGRQPLPRVLPRRHPQPEHPARLRRRRPRLLRLAGAARRPRPRRRRAGPRRGLRRAARPDPHQALASPCTWRRSSASSPSWSPAATLKRSPAVEVKGPTFSRRVGATPVTSTEEVRKLLDGLPTDSLVGLRDRALIGTLLFTTARIGAALWAARSATTTGRATAACSACTRRAARSTGCRSTTCWGSSQRVAQNRPLRTVAYTCCQRSRFGNRVVQRQTPFLAVGGPPRAETAVFAKS